jgi:magnesium transporter
MLDVVVDSYFDAIFDEYYDVVSEGIFADQPLDPSKQPHGFEMRRAMVHFHRAGGSHARGGQFAHAARAIRRFRSSVSLLPGCLHHTLRVTESSDSLRDLVSTIIETNFRLRDFRQNLFVTKVSSWAAIIAVPALVTGYYGMNVPYPGSGLPSGVITSTELIGILSFGLYILFRKRDWL